METKYKIVETVMSNGISVFKAKYSKRATDAVGNWVGDPWQDVRAFKNYSSMEEAKSDIDKHIQEEKDRIKIIETIEHVYPPETK